MDKKNDGGPAFPTPELDGMTLRDWFAGQAIQGLLSSGDFRLEVTDTKHELSGLAYRYADAMLAERDKED